MGGMGKHQLARVSDGVRLGKSRRAGTHATQRNASFELCRWTSRLTVRHRRVVNHGLSTYLHRNQMGKRNRVLSCRACGWSHLCYRLCTGRRAWRHARTRRRLRPGETMLRNYSCGPTGTRCRPIARRSHTNVRHRYRPRRPLRSAPPMGNPRGH